MSLTEDKNGPSSHRVRAALERIVPLPPEEWNHLAELLVSRELAKGESLTAIGEVAVELAFVATGLIVKQSHSRDGRTVIRGFAKPGDWAAAYVSFISRTPSHLEVRALSSSRLFTITWDQLERLYRRHAVWQELGRRLAESVVIEREARAHELLVHSASERYERFCREHAELLPLLRNYEIASYLGITAVSLSRIRARRGPAREG